MMGRGKVAASIRRTASSVLQAHFDEVWIIITAIPLLLAAVLSSCRTLTTTTTTTKTTTRDSLRSDLHKIVNITYMHDSIYIRERGDTVYVDRWHTRLRDSIVESHDTVCIVTCDSIPYEVEVPIEVPYIPKFYERCTIGFWLLLLIIIGSITIRVLAKYIKYRARML